MIKKVKEITDYLGWLDAFICDEQLSTPFYDKERILSVAQKESSLLLAAYEEEELTGIFCLLLLDDEKYIETLFLYTRKRRAYEEMMDYLSKHYAGYEIWFVFNPMNEVLKTYLSEKQAFFYEKQRYMEYQCGEKENVSEIIPYSDYYRNAYIGIHSKDGYWDGEKMLANIDEFYICLCIRDNRLVGYIDLSKGSKINEIMDIFVLPEYRNAGIGALLLKKAIFINDSNRLVLTVDVDNVPANHLYEKIGFEEMSSNNCVTAKVTL